MGRNEKQKQAEILARRRQVAARYVQHVDQQTIAEELGVDQSTISRDIKALTQQWHREAVADIMSVKAREAAELDAMERDCAEQFRTTKDPRWITERRQIKERRAKLLGLDAQKAATNIQIPWDVLTDEQLERIAAGEDPLLVVRS